MQGEQFTLWNPEPEADPEPTEQQVQIERVTARIGRTILAFFERKKPGQEFHADDIRRAVRRDCGQVAPGSPDRIMRALRQQGAIGYEVVNRAQSLYRKTQPTEQEKPC